MSPEMAVSGGDGRPPGSSGEGRLNAPSQFGIKKDIPIPHIGHQVTRNISMVLFCGVKAIIISEKIAGTGRPHLLNNRYPGRCQILKGTLGK